MRRRLLAVFTSLSCLTACGDAAFLPASDEDLAVIWEHTTWRPPVNAQIDVEQAPPSRLARYALSTNVGEVKVIEGDDTNVSTVGSGYGLRMDQGRQDLARISTQVIDEEGDHFDFIVVFPTFQDGMNAGFAYFTLLRNDVQGIGLGQLDASHAFGSQGRLQGMLNMNRPAAYTDLDGRSIDNAQSVIHPVMGQEMSHRWLSHARVRKTGFNGGQASDATLGRDRAHWSALMHTGPSSGPISVSVQDGVAWRDNGNGTFTALEVFNDTQRGVSLRSRFSTLDLYLMGFLSSDEVDPFFLITNATHGNQSVGATTQLTQGITISGTRVGFTVDDVIAAEGWRVPSVASSPKRFNVAMVVLTQPGQSASDVAELVAQVNGFRTQWEQRFSEWTGGVASVCTRLNGCDDGGGGTGGSTSSSSSSGGSTGNTSGGTGGASVPPGTTQPPEPDRDNGCSCGPNSAPGADTMLVVSILWLVRRRSSSRKLQRRGIALHQQ
ncbi:MAG: MYXO-CTERM sorting domain-containing protein [Myxococcota bacterium]